MRNVRSLFALTALMVVAGTWVYTQQRNTQTRNPNSHVLLSPEDYIEIQQLYGFYTRDVDPGSRREATWMFTDDAVADMGGRKYVGREQITEQYRGARQRQSSGVRHFNSTYVIVGTPDGGARGSSYMMTVERQKEGGPVEVSAFGKYEDRFVKTPRGWRFKERSYIPDQFRGSTKPIPPSPIPGDE